MILTFKEPVKISTVNITFQGGFVGLNCEFWIQTEEKDQLSLHKPFYPRDNNAMQPFELACEQNITKLKIVFKDSSDFFGRIVIYALDVLAQ